MPSPRLHVLPWNQPLVHAVTDWLVRGWNGKGPLDLADTLVVVPTAQAGRRLREALAGHAAKQQQAVFPPRVTLPDALALLDAPTAGVATRTELLLAWAETLRMADMEALRDVFPIDPAERTFAWAVRLGREFVRLQTTLAENGLRMGDVASRAGDAFPEAARWGQLGELEAACEAALAERGLRDPQAERIAGARAPVAPAGVKRIVVAGTPDPLALAVRVLAAHADAGLPVEVLVAGPADGAEALFDEWGRPVAAVWATRAYAPVDFKERVRLCADPAAQAALIVSCASGYTKPGGRLGVGVADAEVLPALEGEFSRAGLPVFNPEGRARGGEALHTLLAALAELTVREPSFAAVAAFLRCPDVMAWLGGSAAKLLESLDELHTRHLPPTLDHARVKARAGTPLAEALDKIALLRVKLAGAAFADGARAVLAEIFKERRFDQARAEDVRAIEAAQAWGEVLAELEAAGKGFPGLAAAEQWELALRALADSRSFDDKPDGSVELQGWLELLWDDVPHLVVAGFNDGRVPDAVVGDAFLPEGLRERLGLRTNAARFARDAYLLSALAAFRAEGRGRLDLLVGKTSTAGEPLRPSRLLLQCADEELPGRVEFLFSPAQAGRAAPAWRRAWKLRPRTDAKIENLSVTSFRDYLKCPFRFYLKRGLRMEEVDPHKAELDAMDFGTLCHAALEAMGRPESPVRDCTDAAVLRSFLLEELEKTAVDWHGDAPVLPLVVQIESARQRLSRVADVQAQLRADGWVIERTEWAFTVEIAGLPVRGKIDRIDRNELTGEVRVIDYKTSDKPVTPAEAHVRGPKRAEDVEEIAEFARFMAAGGEEAIWVDLQLPLYLEAVAAEFGHAVGCGYFNLPKAAGETGLSLWDGYDADMQASAMRCARGVAEAVKARIFWPPAELPEAQDEFAVLFPQGAEASVEWTGEVVT
jgi:ATP-dependent helicase/nuclease subunit B